MWSLVFNGIQFATDSMSSDLLSIVAAEFIVAIAIAGAYIAAGYCCSIVVIIVNPIGKSDLLLQNRKSGT